MALFSELMPTFSIAGFLSLPLLWHGGASRRQPARSIPPNPAVRAADRGAWSDTKVCRCDAKANANRVQRAASAKPAFPWRRQDGRATYQPKSPNRPIPKSPWCRRNPKAKAPGSPAPHRRNTRRSAGKAGPFARRETQPDQLPKSLAIARACSSDCDHCYAPRGRPRRSPPGKTLPVANHCNARGIRTQIRDRCRNGFRPCPGKPGQAGKRAICRIVRNFIPTMINSLQFRKLRKNRLKLAAGGNDKLAATPSRPWNIARKLNHVAKALIGHQQKLPFRNRCAVPLRFFGLRQHACGLRQLKAPFVFFPTGLIVSAQKQNFRFFEMRFRIIGL